MPFPSLRSFLDGSEQIIYTAPVNGIIGITASVRPIDDDPVTVSAWIESASGDRYSIAKDLVLDNTSKLAAFNRLVMAAGDKLIVQATGTGTGVLGDILGTAYGNDTRAIIASSYLVLNVNSTHPSCGTCSVGGKILEIPDSSGINTINVDLNGVTLTAGNIQIHQWRQAPNTALTGREWIADVPITGGSFDLDIPTTNFYGLSIFAKNNSNSGYYDAVCCTWNKATRTISLRSF
jgi:hypothetical protein